MADVHSRSVEHTGTAGLLRVKAATACKGSLPRAEPHYSEAVALPRRLQALNHMAAKPPLQRLQAWWQHTAGQLRLARSKPMLAWQILRFHLHHKLSKGIRLRTCDMMVTGVCNFNCSHCYASQWNSSQQVPLEAMEHAIRQLRQLGVFHYILQGGEPLCDVDRLRAIIRLCHPQRSYINVVTNGWLLTDELIATLKADGVSKIAVSIDSGIADEHDAFRNKPGSWERATNALAAIRRAGLQTSISTTVSHQNIHSEGMRSLFDFAREHRYRVNINPANMSGNWEGCEQMLLTEDDSDYLLQMHLAESNDPHGMALIGRDLYYHHGLVGCPSVKEQLSISATGDVFPCVFIHIALGNIQDQSIRSMVEAAMENPYFANWHHKCLGGEDREFINRYISPYVGCPKPLNGREVFGIAGLCHGGRYDATKVSADRAGTGHSTTCARMDSCNERCTTAGSVPVSQQ